MLGDRAGRAGAGDPPDPTGRVSDAVLAAALRGHASAMLLVDLGTGTIVAANDAAAGLYGRPPADLAGLRADTLDAGPQARADPEATTTNPPGPWWHPMPGGRSTTVAQRLAGGEIRLVTLHPSSVPGQDDSLALVTARVAPTPLDEDLLTLVADAISDVMAVQAVHLDAAVDRTLARIGRRFDVDRSYVFRFDEDDSTMSNTHEWVAPGINAELDNLQGIPTDATPWWIAQLRDGRTINLHSLDDLPAEAATERAILEPQGIQSLLILPLVWRDRLDGFVGFDHVRARRRWRLEEVEVLRLIAGIIAQSLDRHAVQQRLERADLVFHNTREAIVLMTADRLVIEINPAFTAITGFTREDTLGRGPGLLSDRRYSRDFYQAIWRTVDTVGIWQGDLWSSRKGGEPLLMRMTLTAVAGSTGTPASYVIAFADATYEDEQEQQLARLASVDGLTGLPNRRRFAELLAGHLAGDRASEGPAAVVLLDVDRFKGVNDSYGHAAGDFLLTTVAARLDAHLASGGSERDGRLARFGGNEFIVLADPVDGPDGAIAVARGLQDAVAAPVLLPGGEEVFVSVCAGIALAVDASDGVEQTLQNADAALHLAKQAGPGSVRVYDGTLVQESRARLSLETRLRQGWERQELWVAYQPQLDVASGRIVGAEALLRWTTASGDQISPGQFIPLAEEIGLIHQVGRWVLDHACRQGRQWLDDGLPPISIAVNLSATQFRDDRLADQVARILHDSGFPADLLELELTESTMIEAGTGTRSQFAALSALGVSLAIDDFGTGYSSFASLKRLPLDKLKVDRTFIRDIVDDSDDRAITDAMIRMGHSLGLRVLAEGVETPGHLALLRDLRCDEFQGFLISPAVPPQRFAALLRASVGRTEPAAPASR